MLPLEGPVAVRAVEALIRLYPRDFRERAGADIRRTYDEALRAAAERRASRTRVWAWLVRDALSTSARIRMESRAERRSKGKRTTQGTYVTKGKGGGEVMTMWWGELKLAVRSLLRAPAVALVSVLTLGLGVGANTAVFGVVHEALLAPLPVPNGERLVWLLNRYTESGTTGAISAPELWEYRRGSSALDGMAAIGGTGGNLTGLDQPAVVEGVLVSPGYFDLIGAAPALGRGFAPEDEDPGTPPVVILSHRLWQGAFGATPDILGSTIQLDERSLTVVGVMPQGHTPLWELLSPGAQVDYWIPHRMDPASFSAVTVERHNLFVVGRLAANASIDDAEADLRVAVDRVEALYPGISNENARDVVAMPLRERIAGDVRTPLLLLSGAVGLVLLLACVNVTTLLIARADHRRSEVAVRAALGAGRTRLTVHALAESVVLGLVGGGVGWVLALVAWRTLSLLAPDIATLGGTPTFGAPVLLFSIGMSLMAGLTAGALPGVRVNRGDLVSGLKSGTHRNSPDRRSQLLNRFLATAQVAGAVVMAAGAGLLLRTVDELESVDAGFDRAELHVVPISASRFAYDSLEAVRQLYEALEERVAAVPGVESVTASWQTPLQPSMSDWPVMPDHGEDSEWFGADPNHVTPSYFDTYGIALLEGRFFDRSDLDRADGPVILNETAARRLWPEGGAVGRRVNLDFRTPVWREVVGVVADVKGRGLDRDARLQSYTTLAPGPFDGVAAMDLTIRSSLDTDEVREAVTAALAAIDPGIPVGRVRSMDEQVAATMVSERTLSLLLSTFGSLALVLGAIGVYGVVAQNVENRRREIGLRMAMGAPPARVLGRVLRQGAVLGMFGVAAGLVGTLWLSGLLESYLFGVDRTDVRTLGLVSAIVLAATLLASVRPAVQAASVDPLASLQGE